MRFSSIKHRVLHLHLAILPMLAFVACNNFGLLDKVENPGASGIYGKLYAFITPTPTNGSMIGLSNGGCAGGGLVQADCACTDFAKAAGLQRYSGAKFVAWLSGNADNMKCRISGLAGGGCAPSGNGPWYNTANQIIASSFEDIFDGNLNASLNLTNTGAVSGATQVWTGTEASGLSEIPTDGSMNCQQWTQGATGNGTIGIPTTTTATWTDNNSTDICNITKPIYCFAVP